MTTSLTSLDRTVAAPARTRVEISVKGRKTMVPCLRLGAIDVIAPGRWLRIAAVRDEAWLDGEPVTDPEACLDAFRRAGWNADIFTFAQKLPHTTPRHDYRVEYDNVAAIPLRDFSSWWNGVPQETRKNVRRAERRGVVIRDVDLDDELIRGIVEIVNETPVRQGRRFWHYGKGFAEVKADYAGLGDRSVYIGAYHGAELVGFIKMVRTGEYASVLQLLCKQAHQDKRPANALLARAVQRCCADGLPYLVYGQYAYGNKTISPLTEFKRRNGFEQYLLPRYHIPLTVKGRLALALGLHRDWKEWLPRSAWDLALTVRAAWYRRTILRHDPAV